MRVPECLPSLWDTCNECQALALAWFGLDGCGNLENKPIGGKLLSAFQINKNKQLKKDEHKKEILVVKYFNYF